MNKNILNMNNIETRTRTTKIKPNKSTIAQFIEPKVQIIFNKILKLQSESHNIK